jgi:hypothetical protein
VIARAIGVHEEAVRGDLAKVKSEPMAEVSQTASPHIREIDLSKRNYIERRLLGILFWQESLLKETIDRGALRRKFIEIIGEKRLAELEDVFLPSKNELIFEAELTYTKPDVLKKTVVEMEKTLEKDILKEQLEGLMRRLYEFEREKKPDEAREILKQCQILSNKIATL